MLRPAPARIITLNWRHPLARRVVSLFTFRGGSTAAAGRVLVFGRVRPSLVLGNGVVRSPDPIAPNRIQVGSWTLATGPLSLGDDVLYDGDRAFTIFLWHTHDSDNSLGEDLFFKFGAGNDSYDVEWRSNEALRWRMRDTANGAHSLSATGGLPAPNGVWTLTAVGWDAGVDTQFIFCVAENRVATFDTATFVEEPGATVHALNVGSSSFLGQVRMFAVLDKAITREEFLDLFADPWGIVDSSRPARRRLLGFVGGVAPPVASVMPMVSWARRRRRRRRLGLEV